MPVKTKARNAQPKTAGRPFGSVTRFPGSCVFADSAGVSASHVYRVLIGERQSKSLVKKYTAFLEAHNLPWPQAAKVQPIK